MKIGVRRVHSTVRLDLTGESEDELKQIRAFVEALNGGPVDPAGDPPILDAQLRVESVGFDDDERVESIAIEQTTTDDIACEHTGDTVIVESSFGLNYWCMDCGAMKLAGEPVWTRPGHHRGAQS